MPLSSCECDPVRQAEEDVGLGVRSALTAGTCTPWAWSVGIKGARTPRLPSHASRTLATRVSPRTSLGMKMTATGIHRGSTSAAGGRLLLGAALLLALLGVGWACLITNCPRGGKRGGSGVGAVSGRSRECVACGPGREGLCVGPGICCGPVFGCLLSARGTCARANTFPPHCTPSSPSANALALAVPLDAPCGADLTPDGSAPGKCAAQGVCCTHDSCRIDAVCQARADDNDFPGPGPGFDTDLMLTSLRRMNSGGGASR